MAGASSAEPTAIDATITATSAPVNPNAKAMTNTAIASANSR